MVGLKAFWILLSTLMLVACVPQTKQTECSSNEAFNASLRTCVPIVQGASSFINISNFTPQFTQTRSKDDTTTLTFSISVSNPYNQSYSVEWERVFNAGPVFMCSNSLTCSFPASFLGTTLGEVGTHILTAKIKDTNGAVVDSHSFELKINELPKPTIISPVTPSSLSFDVYPTEPRVQFSFNIRNNGATISPTDNYRTIWTILKNGSFYLSETDSFTNFTSTGTNTAYLGTSPTPLFNPGTFGVGTYSIRASVQNDNPGEIVAEQYWNVVVKQPDLSHVTTIAEPAPGVTTTAHNNIDYNDFPTLSWIYGGSATQPNFCVTVNDRDGTYASDGKSIQVKFYLDGLGGDICTKKTLDTAGSQKICLVDANLCETGGIPTPFDTSILKFANSSSSVQQVHKVTARLFDEATSLEFDRSNVDPSNGSYPIEWNVLVKPVNTAPQMAFGPTANNPTGCTSSGSFTKANCLVNQNEPFVVSFTVTDDFYNPAIDPNEFQWNVNLKLNGVDVPGTETVCSKAFGTVTTIPSYSGPYQAAIAAAPPQLAKAANQWSCQLAVPHFTSSGPLHPSAGSFSVVATMQDSGSPVGGAGLISQSLNWNLVVTEKNPSNIAISPQTAINTDSNISKGLATLDPFDSNSYATELDTVTFRINVTDAELDDFKYRISLCTINTPTPCTGSVAITSPSYMDFIRSIQGTPSLNPVLVAALAYQLPEDLLLQVSPQLDVSKTVSSLVYFKVDVTDTPSVPLTVTKSDSKIFQLYVRNYNPAPVIDTLTASPAVGSTTVVYSGYPFTINPGTVTDTGPTSETSILYQWYAKTGAGAWTAIAGATTKTLRYTPGNITTNIELKLCVGDRAAANPVSSTGTCTGVWNVTPKKYLENLTATNTDLSRNEIAVWYDNTNPAQVPNTETIYTAYVANAGIPDYDRIFVEKTIKNAAGNILKTTTINFSPISSTVDASGTISNLSITGTDNSVYVAYIASLSSAPGEMVPRVRRIDKSFTATSAKFGMNHLAPFGFNYDHYDGTSDCSGSPCAQVDFVAGDGLGGYARIELSGTLSAGNTITINGKIFTASPTPTAENEFCDGTICGINSTATNLVSKINNSTDPALQGIRAVVDNTLPALSIIQLYGQYHDDYIDFGLTAASSGMGKIFIVGSRWYLPIINASLPGTSQNNITVLSGSADEHMRANPVASSNVLPEMGKTALFDASLNQAGELVFARISGDVSDAGRMKIFRYTLSGSDWIPTTPAGSEQTSQDIFGLFNFEYVKLATDTIGNNHYYVIARERAVDGGEYHMGRYNPNLDTAVASLEYYLTNQIITTDSTDDVINDSKLKVPELVSMPNTQEARIFFHSVGMGATPYPRLARWRSDNTIACGGCESLTGTQSILSTSNIGVSQVAPGLTLGAAGSIAGENIKDVIFTGFHVNTSGAPTVYLPYLGIINAKAESIQSSTIDSTGLWRPPFALDQ